MVVSGGHGLKVNMVEPQPLKFGMDRILSKETSSNSNRIGGSCNSAPPCAGCLTSLYRSCRTNLGMTNIYRNGIQMPQPLRPYANVLMPSEPNIHLNNQQPTPGSCPPKQKRSWSRAVFSNLQRKGLEKRFQLQKYITKPDRRQLAATLGLTDAQVKVWFQNRRMKWRHAKESSRQNPSMKETVENVLVNADSTQNQNTESDSGSDIDVQTVDN